MDLIKPTEMLRQLSRGIMVASHIAKECSNSLAIHADRNAAVELHNVSVYLVDLANRVREVADANG